MFFSAFPVQRGSVGISSPKTCFSILIKQKQFKSEIQYAVLPLVRRCGNIAYFSKGLNQIMVFKKEFSPLQLGIKENIGQQKRGRRRTVLNVKLLDSRIIGEGLIGRLPMCIHPDLDLQVSFKQRILVSKLTIYEQGRYSKCIVIIFQEGRINHLRAQIQMPEKPERHAYLRGENDLRAMRLVGQYFLIGQWVDYFSEENVMVERAERGTGRNKDRPQLRFYESVQLQC